MRRVKDRRGVVHYGNPADQMRTLCAADAFDIQQTMFDPPEQEPWQETDDRVTCKDCAKVVCAIRNEPYNTLVADIDDATLDTGIYEAVKPDGRTQEGGNDGR